jgi:hypothetical protein
MAGADFFDLLGAALLLPEPDLLLLPEADLLPDALDPADFVVLAIKESL